MTGRPATETSTLSPGARAKRLAVMLDNSTVAGSVSKRLAASRPQAGADLPEQRFGQGIDPDQLQVFRARFTRPLHHRGGCADPSAMRNSR